VGAVVFDCSTVQAVAQQRWSHTAWLESSVLAILQPLVLHVPHATRVDAGGMLFCGDLVHAYEHLGPVAWATCVGRLASTAVTGTIVAIGQHCWRPCLG
jgi:hypothetical protein